MAIKDSIASYNSEYGAAHGQVGIDPNGKHLWLRREAFKSLSGGHRYEQVSLAVSFDPKKALVSTEEPRFPDRC